MQKIIFLFLICVSFNTIIFAQNEIDALRYSQYFYGGTARSSSMAGGFNALGADFSALSINPASIALYRSSELTFSPSIFYNKTNSTYKENEGIDYKYDFNFSSIGFVTTFKPRNSDESNWKSTSFGVGYNRLNHYDNNFLVEGINNQNSLIDYFVVAANGTIPSDLDYYGSGLAKETGLIDTVSGSRVDYRNPYNVYGQTQRKEITTKGGAGEYLFSLGSNYKNILYIGATLAINKINYEENSTFTEIGEGDILGDVDNFVYRENILVSGLGYSFKAGVLVRPLDYLRFGVAMQTPIFYSITDSHNSYLEVKYSNGDIVSASSDYLDSEYDLTTPIRLNASLGFTWKKLVAFGLDYELIDYSTARMRDTKYNYNFLNENKAIQKSYRAASGIKAGVEICINNLRFRGGYGYYQSPYKTGLLNDKSVADSYTFGFGIKDDDFFLDFAFVHLSKAEKYYLYTLNNFGSTDPVETRISSNQLTMTVGFKF